LAKKVTVTNSGGGKAVGAHRLLRANG